MKYQARLHEDDEEWTEVQAISARQAAMQFLGGYCARDPDYFKGADIEVRGYGVWEVSVEWEPSFSAVQKKGKA